MIEIQNLTKKYGLIKAVNNLNFTVEKGEVLGFLGPNGAGKSTTMNMITGIIPSTEGTVKVDGFDIFEQPREVKKRIGYLPEIPPLYMDMTVKEYLQFVCELKMVEKSKLKGQLADIMALVKIADHSGRLIKNLSKGYKQRVGLAQALIGNPEVLILDEPTVGLDPKQIIEIRNLIKDIGKQHTIILSSHILPEVSAVCDRVVIINKGRIVAVDTPENLSRSFTSSTNLSVTIAGPKEAIENSIKGIEGVKSIQAGVEKEDEVVTYTIDCEKEVDVRRPVFLEMAKAGYPILEFKTIDATLEDIFIQLVTNENAPVPETVPLEAEADEEDGMEDEASENEDVEEGEQ